jgi:hypothetical protein
MFMQMCRMIVGPFFALLFLLIISSQLYFCRVLLFTCLKTAVIEEFKYAPIGPQPPQYRGFTITLRHTTLGRIPLDE